MSRLLTCIVVCSTLCSYLTTLVQHFPRTHSLHSISFSTSTSACRTAFAILCNHNIRQGQHQTKWLKFPSNILCKLCSFLLLLLLLLLPTGHGNIFRPNGAPCDKAKNDTFLILLHTYTTTTATARRATATRTTTAATTWQQQGTAAS